MEWRRGGQGERWRACGAAQRWQRGGKCIGGALPRHLRIAEEDRELGRLVKSQLHGPTGGVARDGAWVDDEWHRVNERGAEAGLQSGLLCSVLAVLPGMALRDPGVGVGVIHDLARKAYVGQRRQQRRAAHRAARFPQAALEDAEAAELVRAGGGEPRRVADGAVAHGAVVVRCLIIHGKERRLLE